jgi:hypothetical protein
MNETMDTQDQVIGVRVRHATTTIANTVVGMTIIADTMSEMIANAQTGVERALVVRHTGRTQERLLGQTRLPAGIPVIVRENSGWMRSTPIVDPTTLQIRGKMSEGVDHVPSDDLKA